MKYARPELKITEICTEDIIRTSTVISTEQPKATMEGYSNMQNYGTQDFSIFEE